MPSIDGKPEFGCPDSIVPGKGYWNGIGGYCGRTNKDSPNYLRNFDCKLEGMVQHWTKSICQKPIERKKNCTYTIFFEEKIDFHAAQFW